MRFAEINMVEQTCNVNNGNRMYGTTAHQLTQSTSGCLHIGVISDFSSD
jgi:hypothetical protein